MVYLCQNPGGDDLRLLSIVLKNVREKKKKWKKKIECNPFDAPPFRFQIVALLRNHQ